MLFRRKEWKQYLNIDDEQKLNEMLETLKKYKAAYKSSDDVRAAQLWCAMLELKKQNLVLQRRIDRMEEVFESAFNKVRQQDLERRQLIKSLERF